MKQTSFDTKQKAEHLLQQAMSIWQQTEHSEYLEGLEQDPVFVLLMNAIAYQSNEIGAEIEQIKTDVIEEFEHLLSLDDTGNPIPGSIAVQVMPHDNLDSQIIDHTSVFTLNDKKNVFSMLPLLNTRAVNAQIEAVQRLDERRWKVTLSTAQTLHDLRGWSFAINDVDFHDLKVSLITNEDDILPLQITGPEEFSELPMTSDFSIDTLIYNRIHAQTSGGGRHGALSSYMNWCAMDLFARQNIRMYFVNWDDDNAYIQHEVDSIDLLFEFKGITDDFSFTRNRLLINTNILVNVERHTASVSSSSPIARLTGGSHGQRTHFLHLLSPDENQMYGSTPLHVRRVMTDRFNHVKLQKLVYNLIGKYHTDFYAFLSLGMKTIEGHIQRMRSVLTDLQKEIENADHEVEEGVYLIIDNAYRSQLSAPLSLNIDYLTTNASLANDALHDGSISASNGLASVTSIAPAVMGIDAIRDADAQHLSTKYLLVTGDRLVTPFDIKIFVRTELLVRYDIVKEMVQSVNIRREHLDQGTYHTFQTVVDVTLKNNKFIQRTFVEKIPTVEIFLQKMIEVRSSNAFPVKVVIKSM